MPPLGSSQLTPPKKKPQIGGAPYINYLMSLNTQVSSYASAHPFYVGKIWLCKPLHQHINRQHCSNHQHNNNMHKCSHKPTHLYNSHTIFPHINIHNTNNNSPHMHNNIFNHQHNNHRPPSKQHDNQYFNHHYTSTKSSIFTSSIWYIICTTSTRIGGTSYGFCTPKVGRDEEFHQNTPKRHWI